jgi:hypothetical protein
MIACCVFPPHLGLRLCPSHCYLTTCTLAQLGLKRRKVTSYRFNLKAIDEEIDKELKSLRGVVETFLKNPEPPTWVPPDYVTPSNREFLTSLRIPSYSNGNPSLLFHDLDVCDGNEIEKIFEYGTPLYVLVFTVL